MLKNIFASACFVAALSLAIACGEEDDDDYGGNGGTLPKPPTIVCDTNCAVPGACADHGGVDCSVGPDIDASVICNDGYKDSSIKYNCY